jgi:hypothetical protein
MVVNHAIAILACRLARQGILDFVNFSWSEFDVYREATAVVLSGSSGVFFAGRGQQRHTCKAHHPLFPQSYRPVYTAVGMSVRAAGCGLSTCFRRFAPESRHPCPFLRYMSRPSTPCTPVVNCMFSVCTHSSPVTLEIEAAPSCLDACDVQVSFVRVAFPRQVFLQSTHVQRNPSRMLLLNEIQNKCFLCMKHKILCRVCTRTSLANVSVRRCQPNGAETRERISHLTVVESKCRGCELISGRVVVPH